jgi:uncharacterized Zn finger protein
MGAPTLLSEAMIRRLASPESFQRGRDYHQQGAVLSVTRRGDQLSAEVVGSAAEPYQVRLMLGEGEITDAGCTCPYDWGGPCKHIVAVLLTYLHNPEQVTQKPTVNALVAGLDATELHSLVVQLARRRPELADLIESEVLALRGPTGMKADSAASPAAEVVEVARPAPAPDPEHIRRHIRGAFRSLGRRREYDEYGYGAKQKVEDELKPWLNQARAFLAAGDARSSVVILEAVTDEAGDDLAELAEWSDDGIPVGDDLGELWTEAILSADLTRAERKAWAERLDEWQEQFGNYCETGFAAAREAAEQGWDYAPLKRVLQGKITNKGAWAGEAPDYADELAVARLNVLERQGRTQEYLYLAQAESQIELYVTMLVKLGRVPEAMEYALKYLTSGSEALTVAQALRAQGAAEEALQMAEHGMGLRGYAGPSLRRWLRDEAGALGQTERALAAGRELLREHPNMDDYTTLEKLAGDAWPTLREEVLAELSQRKEGFSKAQVDILLREGRVGDAIALVDLRDYYDVVEPVVDAALESHPDWAIRACQAQAERIMNGGQSKYYRYAADWLEKARTAYLNAGREAEWKQYLQEVIDLHRRKYSLVPLLERLPH